MSTAVPQPIADFITVVNAHDKEGFLDAFTELRVVDDWGREFSGRTAIEAWSDKEFIGSEGTLTVLDVTTDGDTVTVIGDWKSSYSNGKASFAFVPEGDKIKSMTIRKA